MGKRGLRIANWIVHIGVWLTCFLLAVFWRRIPDKVVMHFNSAGEADGRGGKGSLIILVVVLLYVYAMHLICLRVIPRLTTREKMYGERLASFVTDEDFAAGILIVMAYLAWTDATMVLQFAYIFLCSALSVPLGGWFVWVLFATLGGEFALYMVCYCRRKRQVRFRAQMGIAPGSAEAERSLDGMR